APTGEARAHRLGPPRQPSTPGGHRCPAPTQGADMAENPLSSAVEFAKMLTAGGFRLDPLDSAPSIEDVRRLAKRRLPTMAFDIIDGASIMSSLARRTSRTCGRCGSGRAG